MTVSTFKKGDRVTVYNQTFSGKPIIEGRATILKPSDVDDHYWVKFDNAGLGDPGRKCQRFVYSGECQDSPEQYLAKAQAEYADRQGELK
jgi:hypothetical protein